MLTEFESLKSLYAQDARFDKPQQLRPADFRNVPISEKHKNYIQKFKKVTRLRNQLEKNIKKELEKSLLLSSQSPPQSPAIAEQCISRRELTNTSETAALNSQLEQGSESGESVVAYSTDLDSINVSITSEASSSELTATSETTAEVPAPRDVVEKPSKKEWGSSSRPGKKVNWNKARKIKSGKYPGFSPTQKVKAVALDLERRVLDNPDRSNKKRADKEAELFMSKLSVEDRSRAVHIMN